MLAQCSLENLATNGASPSLDSLRLPGDGKGTGGDLSGSTVQPFALVLGVSTEVRVVYDQVFIVFNRSFLAIVNLVADLKVLVLENFGQKKWTLTVLGTLLLWALRPLMAFKILIWILMYG